MERRFLSVLILVSFLFLLSCKQSIKDEIVVCGDDKVLILDAERSTEDSVCVVWEWKAADVFSQIPEELHRKCRNMDECKPVDDNTKLLVTSSAGIALLLDRETKKCLF